MDQSDKVSDIAETNKCSKNQSLTEIETEREIQPDDDTTEDIFAVLDTIDCYQEVDDIWESPGPIPPSKEILKQINLSYKATHIETNVGGDKPIIVNAIIENMKQEPHGSQDYPSISSESSPTNDDSLELSYKYNSSEDIFQILQNSSDFTGSDLVPPELHVDHLETIEEQDSPEISERSEPLMYVSSISSKSSLESINLRTSTKQPPLPEEISSEVPDILGTLENSETFCDLNDICMQSNEEFSHNSEVQLKTDLISTDVEHKIPLKTDHFLKSDHVYNKESPCTTNVPSCSVSDNYILQDSKNSFQSTVCSAPTENKEDNNKTYVSNLFDDYWSSSYSPMKTPPPKPPRKKKSPSVPSIPLYVSQEQESPLNFEVNKIKNIDYFPFYDAANIMKPPIRRKRQNDTCVKTHKSYSLSDISQIGMPGQLQPLDFIPCEEDNGLKKPFDNKSDCSLSNIKSSHSPHNEHLSFSSPEVTNAIVDYDYLRPNNLHQRASICLMESPYLVESTEEKPKPRKTPRFKRKSMTFTSADTYFKETRGKVINREKVSTLSSFLKRTFSMKSISKADNPPCMPNLLKRFNERRRRRREKKNQSLATIYEEAPSLKKSESFASIFIPDEEENIEEVEEELTSRRQSMISDWNFSSSLEFPSDNSLKRATSDMELSQLLACSQTPPIKELKRSSSFIQSTKNPKSFIMRFVTQDSTVSLDPEAIKRAQELLNKSIGSKPGIPAGTPPVPPKRTRSKLSLSNSKDDIKFSNDCKLGSIDFANIDKIKKKLMLTTGLDSDLCNAFKEAKSHISDTDEKKHQEKTQAEHEDNIESSEKISDHLSAHFHDHDISLDNCKACLEANNKKMFITNSHSCLSSPNRERVQFHSADNLNKFSGKCFEADLHCKECKVELGLDKTFNLLKYNFKNSHSNSEKSNDGHRVEDNEDKTALNFMESANHNLAYENLYQNSYYDYYEFENEGPLFPSEQEQSIATNNAKEDFEMSKTNENICKLGISYALAHPLTSSREDLDEDSSDEFNSSFEESYCSSDYNYAFDPVMMNTKIYFSSILKAMAKLKNESRSKHCLKSILLNREKVLATEQCSSDILSENDDPLEINLPLYQSSINIAYLNLQSDFVNAHCNIKNDVSGPLETELQATSDHQESISEDQVRRNAHLCKEDLKSLQNNHTKDSEIICNDSIRNRSYLYQEKTLEAIEDIRSSEESTINSIEQNTKIYTTNLLEVLQTNFDENDKISLLRNTAIYNENINRAMQMINPSYFSRKYCPNETQECVESSLDERVLQLENESAQRIKHLKKCAKYRNADYLNSSEQSPIEQNTKVYKEGLSQVLVTIFGAESAQILPQKNLSVSIADESGFSEGTLHGQMGKKLENLISESSEAEQDSTSSFDIPNSNDIRYFEGLVQEKSKDLCSKEEHLDIAASKPLCKTGSHTSFHYDQINQRSYDSRHFLIFQPLSLQKLSSEVYYAQTATKRMLYKNLATSKHISDYLTSHSVPIVRKKSVGTIGDSQICIEKLTNSVSSRPTIQHLCLGQPNYAKSIDSEYPCDFYLAHSQPPSLPNISEDDYETCNRKKSLLKRRSLKHSSDNILKIVTSNLNKGTFSKIGDVFYFPFRPNSALNSTASSTGSSESEFLFPKITYNFSLEATSADAALKRSHSENSLLSTDELLSPSSPTYRRVVKVHSPLSERKFFVCSFSEENLTSDSKPDLTEIDDSSDKKPEYICELTRSHSDGDLLDKTHEKQVIFSKTEEVDQQNWRFAAFQGDKDQRNPKIHSEISKGKQTFVFPYHQMDSTTPLSKVKEWAELYTSEEVPVNYVKEITDFHTQDEEVLEKNIEVNIGGIRSNNENEDNVFLPSENEGQNVYCQCPCPVYEPRSAQNALITSLEDTPSPGPPRDITKEKQVLSGPPDSDKQKKDEDRTQKDRCIEIYPETIRQRQRNMAPSPTKVDIRNFEGSSEAADELSRGKKFLPSVKALRHQFENGKVSPTSNGTSPPLSQSPPTLGRNSSNSSNSSLNNLPSIDTSSGFNSLTSSHTTTDASSTCAVKDEDESVEPIFSQFKQVDRELKELMSKPPISSTWDAIPLLKKLYYVPEAPKMHSKGTNFINIEGYLEKLPSGRKKATFWNAWKRRYFAAKDGILYYYQSNQADKASMKLSLMGGKIEIMEHNNMINVDDGKGHYVVVRCSSKQEAERWKHALESHTVDDFSRHFVQPWPRPTNPTLLRDTLIIDLGSCSVRAGVLASQATLPQVFFPSVLATNRETKRQIWGFEALSSEIRSTSSVSFPIRPSHKISKYSVDLTAVSSLIQKAFTDLKVDPKNYNIQLSVPRVLNPHTQSELLRIMFEKFGVKSVNLTHQSILALYAYNATSGIVVDIGERLDVVPVIDGYIVDGGVSRVPYGGYRIMEHLRQFLFQKNVSLVNEVESYLLRSVLESICYCAQHYNTEKARCTNEPQMFEKSIPFSEYHLAGENCEAFRNISLDFGRFQATEGIFNPDAWGLDHPGLHKLVHKAIQECSMDIRKEMSRSIFLAGGVSQLSGLSDRLSTELDNLTPTAIHPKVHASPYRYHAAYLGACVLAESPAFAQSKIDREEWIKQGNSALRKWAL